MTKKKTAPKPNYVSYYRRNEINGQIYERNEITTLEGLTDEQIISLLKMRLYGVIDPELLPKSIAEGIGVELVES